MKNFANSNIQKMKSYSPPIEGRRFYSGFLLDFNERTVPYDDVVRNVLWDFVSENKFERYPEYRAIDELVANYAGVSAENILLTNGSDQGIDLIFRTFTKLNDEVIIPSPSFAMFYQCAQMGGNKIITPAYDNVSGSFPIRELLQAINKKTKLIVICNPNNPTGCLVGLDVIENILVKAKDAMVLVDEAYFEYARLSAVKLIEKYQNLVITRTFSKAFGLAALRVGYIIAGGNIIGELKKVRGPYDVNTAGAVAVAAVLKNLSPLNSYVDEVMTISKPMVENFFRDCGIFFYPSCSDFILFKIANATTVFELLKKEGFLLRPRSEFGFDNTLRLTFGTVAQTKQFIKVFTRICAKSK